MAKWVMSLALVVMVAMPAARADVPEALSVTKIWDAAPHNAFTDLVRFQDRWYCTFREGTGHVAGEGKLRVLVSEDGEAWSSAALLAEDGVDLRDPKLSVMPDGRLMLLAGGSIYHNNEFVTRWSRVAFSEDGSTWSDIHKVLPEGEWLWRITWREGRAWGFSYSAQQYEGDEPLLSLWSTEDGLQYDLVKTFDITGGPSEATLRFTNAGEMVALLRRYKEDSRAWIGASGPPYTQWQWHTTNQVSLGGPNFVILPDGQMWAAGRSYPSQQIRTVLFQMSLTHLAPTLALPSGDDTSYPGMVWHNNRLWMSYYSSHEGKSSIYFAEIRIPGYEPTSGFDWSAAGVQELAPGVLRAHVQESSPRPLNINVLRIDTAQPGVGFYTTAPCDPWVSGSQEAPRQTTRAFVAVSEGADKPLVAAVNANVFDWTSPCTNLMGLAVSEGTLVSPAQSRPSLIIDQDGAASMMTTHSYDDISHVETAVSGFAFHLIGGNPSGPWTNLEPRTGIGLSQGSRYVYFMTIDGRQPGFSEGVSEGELGEWLKHFGAYTGINMDGGGSTTMAWWDGDARNAALLNSPSGAERAVGNNIGVYYGAVPDDDNGGCPPGDLTGDCAVGLADLAVLAANWLRGPEAAGAFAAGSAARSMNPILWSEDFSAYAAGDLPSQDSTWSVAASPAITPWVEIWQDSGNNHLAVGGATTTSANHNVHAYKDLSAEFSTVITPLEVSFDASTSLGLATHWGHQGAFRFYAANGNQFVYLFFRENPTSGAIEAWLHNAAIAASYVAGANNYRFVFDFDAQQAVLYVNGALAGQTDFYEPAAAGDLATFHVNAGLYFPAATARNTTVRVDNVLIADGRDWTCPVGDLNDDCLVNLQDFSMLAAYWLAVGSEP